MSLLFNMLSMLVIAFLPKSKHLLISWLQSPSAVILEPKKIKPVTVSTFSPSVLSEMMWPDAMILDFWMLNFKPAFSLNARSQHEESRPWQRSWGRGLTGKGEIRPRGNSPVSSQASTPKIESVCLTALCLSPTSLTLIGAVPPPPFSGKS